MIGSRGPGVPVASRGTAALILVALTAFGCGSGSVEPEDDRVVVTGTVTRIVDETPVDGGITIDLARQGGGREVLLFGSLFTHPPPGPDRLALYERVKEARVGSRVRATGRRTGAGIELTDFEVLIP